MRTEHWLYIVLALLVLAFVWVRRIARERRRRRERLRRSIGGVTASRTSAAVTQDRSRRSEMRGAESKSVVMEQLAKGGKPRAKRNPDGTAGSLR